MTNDIITKAQTITATKILDEVIAASRPKPIVTPTGLVLQRLGPTVYPVYKRSTDGRILFAVGFNDYVSDTLIISFDTWHVIDKEGIIKPGSDLTQEEVNFINAKVNIGPYGRSDLIPFSRITGE